MQWWWLLPALALALVPVVLLAWRRWQTRREDPLDRARRQFQLQREHLEAHFLTAAAATGKPRGLRWKSCEWESDVLFARERKTGLLVALVGVTIQFEAVEGSDMEGLPAVGNLRNATAVFCYYPDRWQTGGKTVFNLNPDEAIAHFQNQYEVVGELRVRAINPSRDQS